MDSTFFSQYFFGCEIGSTPAILLLHTTFFLSYFLFCRSSNKVKWALKSQDQKPFLTLRLLTVQTQAAYATSGKPPTLRFLSSENVCPVGLLQQLKLRKIFNLLSQCLVWRRCSPQVLLLPFLEALPLPENLKGERRIHSERRAT